MGADLNRTTLFAGVVAAALSAACEQPPPAAPPPPPEVYVTSVIQRDVPVYLELVGQTEGFQDVEIRARVEGFLETVNFREGSFVKQGDLLYRSTGSRSKRFLRQAKADQATAEARLAKANNDVTRYTPLVAEAGGQQAGARQRGRRTGRVALAGGGRQGCRGEGDARSRLHADHLADHRARRDHARSRRAISSDAARARC